MGYNDKYPDMSAMYSVMFAAEDKLKEEIAALKQELDRTRKALDVAVDYLQDQLRSFDGIEDDRIAKDIRTLLEQINEIKGGK